MISDIKNRLRDEYRTNKELCLSYTRLHKDFDDDFFKARKRNSEIIEYMRLVFKMKYEAVLSFLESE